MTIDEFLEKLKETPRRWVLEGQQIRYPRHLTAAKRKKAMRTWQSLTYCPICKVAGDASNRLDYFMAGERIGIAHSDALAIAKSADCDSDCDRDLREKLLDACGLSPSGARTT